MLPSLPSDLSLALMGVTTFLSAKLRDDGLPPSTNFFIALVALLVELGFTFWLVIGFSGSLKDITLEFIALAIAMCGKELFSLIQYLEASPSPFAPKPTLTPPLVRRASAAFIPPDNNTKGS